MTNLDTIAAVSTSIGNSGIGIVRVSGQDAISIVSTIYRGSKNLDEYQSHTINYGHIYVDDQIIDEVMVSIMRAPSTYTREDVVEINCHGGMLVVKKVLEAVISAGARIADPGEFTKRAFLNGRIDLSQAESVMDLINSSSEFAHKTSIKQLNGSLKDKIIELRASILYQIAYIESALDDPEHISLDGFNEELESKLNDMLDIINNLIKKSDEGILLKDGIDTAIVGKPNAGKSSLLNALAGKERSIVTDIPGTTRDTIEERIILDDIILNIIDTAGIRDTDDIVEQIGVDRSKQAIEDASLVIFVLDSSRELDDNDKMIMEFIKDKQVICLLNKSDLNSVISEEDLSELNANIISISAREGDGLDRLSNEIKELFFQGNISGADEVFVTNARHKEALLESKVSLEHVKNSIELGMEEDFLSIDLMDVYKSLGKIIGETLEDDLVEEIFSKFCMGK